MKLLNLFLISLIFQFLNIQILYRSNSAIASENIEIKNSIDKNKVIKTVIANGYGVNIDAAAQHAAKNALTNVVGEFIDAETKSSRQATSNHVVVTSFLDIKFTSFLHTTSAFFPSKLKSFIYDFSCTSWQCKIS
tara:strand:+ start:86 stop:490 length:405 start_codon:yes stop_codon:yes gene_type:complete